MHYLSTFCIPCFIMHFPHYVILHSANRQSGPKAGRYQRLKKTGLAKPKTQPIQTLSCVIAVPWTQPEQAVSKMSMCRYGLGVVYRWLSVNPKVLC